MSSTYSSYTIAEYLSHFRVDATLRQTITVVFGTGISKALSRSDAADWPGQIRHLAARLKDLKGPIGGLDVNALLQCARSHHYTGLLHMIRRELGDLWDRELDACITEVMRNRRSDTDPVVRRWIDVLQALGKLAKEGRARLATTNFDHMVACEAGLNVITREGQVFETSPPNRQIHLLPQLELQTDETPPSGLTSENRLILDIWGNLWIEPGKLQRGVLERTAGVLHLHGWYKRPKQLIVDPVEYHLAAVRAHSADLAASMLLELLQKPNSAVILVGMGDTMHDDHFEKLLQLLAKRDPLDEQAAAQNVWLLPHSEAQTRVSKMRLPQDAHGNHLELGHLLQVVTYDDSVPGGPGQDHSKTPEALQGLVNHFSPSVQNQTVINWPLR